MKKIKLIILLIICMSGIKNTNLMAQNTFRKDLLSIDSIDQRVTNIQIKEVTIPMGEKAAFHLHPCPVIGYIVSGSVLFQVEGQKPKILEQGTAFYEPKTKNIVHFDNASQSEPLVFVAYYLRNGDEELIELLKE